MPRVTIPTVTATNAVRASWANIVKGNDEDHETRILAVEATFVGNQAPGSFTIATEQFGLHGKRLTLTTTQRATIEGTGRLVING